MANPSGLVNLPSNIYAGGAVKLDTHPLMNFIAQTMYRNRIRDEAMDRYFANLGNRLTPSGMHNNDVPDFMEKKNAWQEYAMKNRNQIMHPNMDNGDAATTANEMYNDAMSTAQRSRSKVANLNELKTVYNDPEKRKLLTDQTVHDMVNAEKPVNDPDYKPLDMSDVHYNPKPFSLQDNAQVENQFNKFKGTPTLTNTTKDAQNLRLIDHYDTKFNKDELSGMAGIGTALYNGSPGFKQMIDSHAHPDDPMYGAINPTFKQHYGHDISTPEDFATAYGLSLNGNAKGKDVPRPDTQALNEQRANLNLRNQKDMQNMRNTQRNTNQTLDATSWDKPLSDAQAKVDALKNSSWGSSIPPEKIAIPLNIDQAGLKGMSPNAKEPYDHAVLHGDGTIGLVKGGQTDENGNMVAGQEFERLSPEVAKPRFLNTYKTGTIKNTTTTTSSSSKNVDKQAEDLINKYKNLK
jgi:hypothetical protein